MLYYFPFYNGVASAVTRIQEGLDEKRMNNTGFKKKNMEGRILKFNSIRQLEELMTNT